MLNYMMLKKFSSKLVTDYLNDTSILIFLEETVFIKILRLTLHDEFVIPLSKSQFHLYDTLDFRRLN